MRRRTKSSERKSSKNWDPTASTEKATPIWPLVAPAISRSRVQSRLRTVGPAASSDLSRAEPSSSRRSACAASRRARERGVGLARAPARRLDPYLKDAEEALDDPLHRIDGLDVIQGYRPFALLEDAPPQPEGAGRDLVGRRPPGQETPEGREHGDDEDARARRGPWSSG